MWKKLSEVSPEKNQICDFLISGDEQEAAVWIVCSVLKRELSKYLYDENYTAWRPAEELPSFIKRGDEK